MNSPEKWELKVDPSIWKVLKKFPKKNAATLTESILLLPVDPYAGDIRKLGGKENIWRRRIGAYRISFELYPSSNLIVVFEVKRRTSNSY